MARLRTTAVADNPTEVNLTPMLDVVFIMLIFFIVTAVFVREQGLPVNPPEPRALTTPPKAERPIVVDLLANRRLQIAGKEIDERLIGAQLARLHAERPTAPVVLRPAPDAKTDMVVKVMDHARLAGIYDIKFAAR